MWEFGFHRFLKLGAIHSFTFRETKWFSIPTKSFYNSSSKSISSHHDVTATSHHHPTRCCGIFVPILNLFRVSCRKRQTMEIRNHFLYPVDILSRESTISLPAIAETSVSLIYSSFFSSPANGSECSQLLIKNGRQGKLNSKCLMQREKRASSFQVIVAWTFLNAKLKFCWLTARHPATDLKTVRKVYLSRSLIVRLAFLWLCIEDFF